MTIASSLILTACGGDSESSGSSSQNITKADPVVNTDNAQIWLNAHNILRQKHQVGNLTWSNELADSAKQFASTCPSQHSKSSYGENMTYADYVQTPDKVVQRWYVEESDYNYNDPNFSMGTGHFSQLVWKNTTQVGCAQVSGCGGEWSDIVVCQYNPSGNYSGEFTSNVFPAQ